MATNSTTKEVTLIKKKKMYERFSFLYTSVFNKI